MGKVSIIYWSGTGNTEIMAENIAEGAKSEGVEVELLNVSEASIDNVINADVVALGCSAAGAEELDYDEMEPFVESLEEKGVSGKKMVLFGSYDWGDGEWMRNWEERMEASGANLIETSLMVTNEPEGDEIDQCKELGMKIAKA